MDKKIFLIDKSAFNERMAEKLTEKDLEEMVAGEGYDNDCTILKIDANAYNSVEEAIENEFPCDLNDYFIFSFGF